MINYIPNKFTTPKKMLDMRTAWTGHETILEDLIERSGIKTNKALEFGVEYGFSLSALASFFDKATGVDTFMGDEHAGRQANSILEDVEISFSPYNNVKLIESDYKDYIKDNTEKFDLIHIDIVHNYKETFECGDWAMAHADMVIFHDTESFPEVKRAVADLAEKHKVNFYNFIPFYGLGILTKHDLYSDNEQ